MSDDPRIDVLHVPVTATTRDRALDRVESWITGGDATYVTFTGVHGVMESQKDPEVLRDHQGAGMVAPDGMPMVWAARMAGVRDVTRVDGPDFFLAMCERAAVHGYPSFFYGGRDGVADQLAAAMVERFPGLQVVGTWCPPFRPLTEPEIHDVARMINESGAALVWVGLSTPKQERWMAEFRPLLDAPVLLGVGAAFDIHSGNIRQAPALVRGSGLEWLYRLMMEPRRLWRRYLTNNPRFVWALARRRPTVIDTTD